MPTIQYAVQRCRGRSLKLSFSIMFKDTPTVKSEIFNIDNLAEVRFQFSNGFAWSRLDPSLSIRKHESATESKIQVIVTCDPNYSKPWICTENWIDWQPIEAISQCTDHDRSKVFFISVSITVSIENGLIANNIYDDEEFTDFQLSTAEGSVAVHRAVLASHSEMFKAMLSREWKEKTDGRVTIDGVTLQTLQHVKQYLYLGTLPDEGLCPLLLFAMCYLIDNLKSACISKLARTVKGGDLEDIISFAMDHKLNELIIAMLQVTPDRVVHEAHEIGKNKLTAEKNNKE